MRVAIDPTFGTRLRQLREAAGLSGAALAEAAGVTAEAVRLIETGEREPRWSTVRKLAKALGVSVAEFERADPPPRKRRKGK